jgi:hypothetical protein
VERLWSAQLDPLSTTEEIFMAGGGNETLLINRHVIGTRLDKVCPQHLSPDRALSSCRSGTGVFAGVLILPLAGRPSTPSFTRRCSTVSVAATRKLLFAAASSSKKSPLRTRTVDPLLTMWSLLWLRGGHRDDPQSD